ncbi:ubiquitin-protein ligase E3A, partial [Magnaporthiopsis poae ATCC 64411]
MEQFREKPLPPLPSPASPHVQHNQHLRPDTNVPSSRTHPTHLRTGSDASRPTHHFGNSNHITDFEFVDGSQLQVDSSDSDDFRRSNTNRRRQAKHGRSMSHPFPSLFHGKRKKKSSDSNENDDSDDLAPIGSARRGHGPSGGSRDVTTSECMTCGSDVCHPRGASGFECTICATLNDLHPVNLGPIDRRSRQAGYPEPERQPGRGSEFARPVSVEHTKLLIKACLRHFIVLSLQPAGAGGSQAPQGLMPPRMDNGGPNETMARHGLPRSYSSSHPDQRPMVQAAPRQPGGPASSPMPGGRDLVPSKIFKPVEDYLVECFTSCVALNKSFGGPPSQVEETRHLFRSPAAPPSFYMDWEGLEEWYATIINAAQPWKSVYHGMVAAGLLLPATDSALRSLDEDILVGQDHVQKLLLRATEAVLRRPGRPMKEAAHLRFVLIILANPFLSAGCRVFTGNYGRIIHGRGHAPATGQFSHIIGRAVGMLANSSDRCHRRLVSWFAAYPENRLIQAKDLVGGFLVYRLLRQRQRRQEEYEVDVTGGLIPNVSAGRSAAALHAALGQSGGQARGREAEQRLSTNKDWQIKAAARAMSLIFTANNTRAPPGSSGGHSIVHRGVAEPARARDMVLARGQLMPTSDFYVTQLDDADITTEFAMWEREKGRFNFCQYPFLLSLGAKTSILKYDTAQQMLNRTRDEILDSRRNNGLHQQHLDLSVRRDCLVEDSLKSVSAVIGNGTDDIKKALRITFRGEDGIDAGGLRKEWFLLLVRDLFNPDHGLFVYDDDSRYCYFNPYSFETSEEYYLVGVVLGLAIYNFNILDIALPPFAFRKLLAAAPNSLMGQNRPDRAYTLDDLAEVRPRLAQSLSQLLEFEGDVESTFCQEFVIEVDKYGSIDRVPLTPRGEHKPVTNSNRNEYVESYVRYLLDKAVARQFEPFKRGFFSVCNGNALSLFRPEEIERLVKGSDEPLDVDLMRAAAEYS